MSSEKRGVILGLETGGEMGTRGASKTSPYNVRWG
jgi:hypothetical protein